MTPDSKGEIPRQPCEPEPADQGLKDMEEAGGEHHVAQRVAGTGARGRAGRVLQALRREPGALVQRVEQQLEVLAGACRRERVRLIERLNQQVEDTRRDAELRHGVCSHLHGGIAAPMVHTHDIVGQ